MLKDTALEAVPALDRLLLETVGAMVALRDDEKGDGECDD